MGLSLLRAQGPSWAWGSRIGGSKDDYGTGIAVDVFGNVYMTGFFESSTLTLGATTLRNAGGKDILVVKYDSSGQIVWAKSVGASGDEAGYRLAVDASGSVYVAGNFASSTLPFASINLRNAGGRDLFVVKYNTDGEVLWAQSAGGEASDYSTDIAIDSIGNVYITGVFESKRINFGSITIKNAGLKPIDKKIFPWDFFLAKYAPNGRLLWVKSFGGNGDDYSVGIAVDASGNTYVTGYFQSDNLSLGTITLSNVYIWQVTKGDDIERAFAWDIFVVKYDPNGQVVWASSAGGSGPDATAGIAVDARGNVYLTGFFGSSKLTFGTTTLQGVGSISLHQVGYKWVIILGDLFVVKYDSNGQMLGAKGVGGYGKKGGAAIATDTRGNAYVVGNFLDDSLILEAYELPNKGRVDTFVGKLKL